jgi:hypothetical protein
VQGDVEVAFDTIEYIHIFSVFQMTLGQHFRVSDCKYTKKIGLCQDPLCASVRYLVFYRTNYSFTSPLLSLFRRNLPYVSPSSVTTMNKAIAGEGFTFQKPSILIQHSPFTRFLQLRIMGTVRRYMKEL